MRMRAERFAAVSLGCLLACATYRNPSPPQATPWPLPKNADGGVTIYVGPKSLAGMESNWIPTAGRRPLPAMRFYGGTEALHKKTFKMPDFEVVAD